MHAATAAAVMTTQPATLPAWSVHLGTTGSTCVRFACDVVRDSDPWPLSRAVADLAAGGASLAERPRALGSGRGIPLVHSQRMCGVARRSNSKRITSATEGTTRYR